MDTTRNTKGAEMSKTAEQTVAAIETARRHAGEGAMASSAALCLADAEALRKAGRLDDAHAAALRSLKYSVGIFHPDYTTTAGTESFRDMVARLDAQRAAQPRPVFPSQAVRL